MILLGLALAFQQGVLSDPRFGKPADFDVSLRQITDFCSDVSKTSGVGLSVDKKVQDLKVDVFVDKKPLAETLDKVAKVLNCEWVPFGKGYKLEMSVVNINRERNFNQAEDAEARHIAETKLWACEYFAKLIPGSNKQLNYREEMMLATERNAIIAPFEQAYQAAMKGTNVEEISEAQLKYTAISEAVGSLDHVNIGHVMLQMDNSAKERFWKGEPVMAGSIPGNGYKLWPSDSLAPSKTLYVSGQLVTKAEYTNFDFLLFDPLTNSLNTRLNSYTASENGFGPWETGTSHGGPFSSSSTRNKISEKLKKLSFYQDLKPWMDAKATPENFTQVINEDTEEWNSPWFSGRRRLGEHLRWLHKATGIPIVAQADRSCLWNWIQLKRPYKTTKEYLKDLMGKFDTYCLEDHEYLVARNYRFWSHRRHEAPEATWLNLKPNNPNEKPDLNLFAKYALQLREDQMRTADLGYPLCEVDITKPSYCYNMLRFYAILSDQQRQTAHLETGLGADEMSSEQQQEMSDLLKKVIFKSGGCSAGMARYLFTAGLESGTMQQMRLHLQESGFHPTDNYLEELKDGDVVVRPSSTVKTTTSQIMFSFRLGKGQTISGALSIDK